MENILLVVHVIVALLIVGLIMLQQGKGAEMGASFGAGASQTVFGAVGSGNFFSRLTAILVAVFFVTSFVLAIMAKESFEVENPVIPVLEKSAEPSAAEQVPVVEDTAPAAEEVPEVPADTAVPEGEVPTAN